MLLAFQGSASHVKVKSINWEKSRIKNEAKQKITHVRLEALRVPLSLATVPWSGLSGPRKRSLPACDAPCPSLLQDGSGFPQRTWAAQCHYHETSASEVPGHFLASHTSKWLRVWVVLCHVHKVLMYILMGFSPWPIEVGPVMLNVRLWTTILREVKRIAQEMELECQSWGLSPGGLPALGWGDLDGLRLVTDPSKETGVGQVPWDQVPLPGNPSCTSFSRQGPQQSSLPFLICSFYQGTRCSWEEGLAMMGSWTEGLKEEGSSWLHRVAYLLNPGSQILFCDRRFTIMIKLHFCM